MTTDCLPIPNISPSKSQGFEGNHVVFLNHLDERDARKNAGRQIQLFQYRADSRWLSDSVHYENLIRMNMPRCVSAETEQVGIPHNLEQIN